MISRTASFFLYVLESLQDSQLVKITIMIVILNAKY